jgi:hypothetical protein
LAIRSIPLQAGRRAEVSGPRSVSPPEPIRPGHQIGPGRRFGKVCKRQSPSGAPFPIGLASRIRSPCVDRPRPETTTLLTLALASTLIASAALDAARGTSSAAEALAVKAETAMAAFDRTPEEPAYLAEERAVSNWRSEAVEDLEPMPLSGAAIVLGAGRPVVTRCVKLNNYWCIKRARWRGEIGFDEEGHVGFATAERGADAAVALLRRYYLDYGRRSALDIVRRWAPAECRTAPAAGGPVLGGPAAGPPAAALPTLAIRGIAGTLRARWLASRRAPALAARSGRAQPKAPAAPPKPAAAEPDAGPAGRSPAPSRPVLAAAAPPGSKAADAASLRRPSPPTAAAARPAAAPPAPPPIASGRAGGPAAPTSKPAGPATAAPRKPAPRRVAAGAPTRASVIPLRPLPTFRVPDIAAGMGERRPAAVSISLLAPRPPAASTPPKMSAPPAAARAVPPRAGAASPRPAPTVSRGAIARPEAVAASAARPRPRAISSGPATAAPPTRSPAPAPNRPTLVATAPAPQAAPVTPVPSAATPPPRPVLFCGDEERIGNYAGRIVQGLDLGPTDDLQLFEPNGMPRPNLARVLLSMSSVELGLLRAGVDLVAEAIERATAKAAEAAALAGERDLTP